MPVMNGEPRRVAEFANVLRLFSMFFGSGLAGGPSSNR